MKKIQLFACFLFCISLFISCTKEDILHPHLIGTWELSLSVDSPNFHNFLTSSGKLKIKKDGSAEMTLYNKELPYIWIMEDNESAIYLIRDVQRGNNYQEDSLKFSHRYDVITNTETEQVWRREYFDARPQVQDYVVEDLKLKK